MSKTLDQFITTHLTEEEKDWVSDPVKLIMEKYEDYIMEIVRSEMFR